MNIVLALEDTYKQALFEVIKKAARSIRRDRGLKISPNLECDSLAGYGGAFSHVQADWRLYRQSGHPRLTGLVDQIVYVLDADVAPMLLANKDGHKQLDGFQFGSELWLREANSLLERQLRAQASADPERVHGFFIRWSKETLLLAAHDQPSSLKAFDIADLAQSQESLYRSCQPDPRSIPDSEFVTTFTKWKDCVAKIEKHLGVKVNKKSKDVEAVLKDFGDNQLSLLISRVPDLRGLGEKLADLCCQESTMETSV